jgi:hypothetical protein
VNSARAELARGLCHQARQNAPSRRPILNKQKHVHWIPLTLIAAIVALGTAASLRYGLWGRRVTAGLFVFVVAGGTPALAPKINGSEAQAITCLRAINAAQLLYSTTLGRGRYAETLEELEMSGPSSEALQGRIVALRSRRFYRIELISTGDRYAVVAVPLANARRPPRELLRAFCVGETATIYQTLGGMPPAVERGRCLDTSKPIQ